MSFHPATTHLVGNLVDEPELRFTPSGVAVCKFRIACTPRVFDPEAKEYKDGEPTFMTCTAWRSMAENIAESLGKGHRVIVVGRLQQENWETKEGEKRSVIACQVDAIGPELTWATAKPVKASRGGGGRGRAERDSDPEWKGASKEKPAGAGSDRGGFDDEPPF
jgi:single-strand DNA-binding protein